MARNKLDAYNRDRPGDHDSQYGADIEDGFCDSESLARAKLEYEQACGDPDVSPKRAEELREELRLKRESYKFYEGY